MQQMGIEAIYPKLNLSKARADHKIYPYLLRGLNIERQNQVWAADITYIRLSQGWLYPVAIMNWFSRYCTFEISTSLEVDFCLRALQRALGMACPEIFNTDQGSQFTSLAFTEKLQTQNIRISMDGRGRAFGNLFTERLWRSLKYEEVYIKDYQNVSEAKDGIERYLAFHNHERLHQSLNYQTPAETYFQRAAFTIKQKNLSLMGVMT